VGVVVVEEEGSVMKCNKAIAEAYLWRRRRRRGGIEQWRVEMILHDETAATDFVCVCVK
jgi:hypothetical protein